MMRTMFKLVPLVLVLNTTSGALLLGAQTSDQVLHVSESYHYSLQLPGTWAQIPDLEVKQAYSLFLPDELKAISAWDAAFQAKDGDRWFTYPYLIVQVLPYSKVGLDRQPTTAEFLELGQQLTGVHLRCLVQTGLGEDPRAMIPGWTITDLQVDDLQMVYEIHLEGELGSVGAVVGMLVGQAGCTVLVQAAFYDVKSAWPQWSGDRQLILNSFRFDSAFAYKPSKQQRLRKAMIDDHRRTNDRVITSVGQSGQDEASTSSQDMQDSRPGDHSSAAGTTEIQDSDSHVTTVDTNSRETDRFPSGYSGSSEDERATTDWESTVRSILGDHWELKLILMTVVLVVVVVASLHARLHNAKTSRVEGKLGETPPTPKAGRMDAGSVYFSFKGRLNRKSYWFATVSLFIWYVITSMMLDSTDEVMAGLGSLFALSAVWPTIAVQVKRWHDRGKSGIWYLLSFVPVLGPLWVFIELGFLKGTAGTNRYGLPPGSEKARPSDAVTTQDGSPLSGPLVDLVCMLAKVAKADGVVSKAEVSLIDEFFLLILRLTPDMRKEAIRIFDQAKSSAIPYDIHARGFYEAFQDNPGLLEIVLDFLVALAFADGELSAEEEILVSQTAAVFGIEHDSYEKHREERVHQKAHASGKPSETYYAEILGLAGQADFDLTDVKQAYRNLSLQYHPDKVAHLGPKLRAVAEEEMKRINEAYAFFTQSYKDSPCERTSSEPQRQSGRTTGAGASESTSNTTDRISLAFLLSESQCYVGQPVQMIVKWIVTVRVKDAVFDVPVFASDDFHIEDVSEPTGAYAKERVLIDGVPVTVTEQREVIKGLQAAVISFSKNLIPRRPGHFVLGAVSVSAKIAVACESGDSDHPDRLRYEHCKVASDQVELHVLPR